MQPPRSSLTTLRPSRVSSVRFARLPLRALLDVITQGKEAGLITKSNLILGMGETNDEVYEALCDLHDAGCDLITLTQYLRPGPSSTPSSVGSSPPSSLSSQRWPKKLALPA